MRPKSVRQINGSFGQAARIGYLAASGAEQSFERLIHRTNDSPVVADSTRWPSFPVAARRPEFRSQAPINSKEPDTQTREHREGWGKGKLVGAKAPLNAKEIPAILKETISPVGARRPLPPFRYLVDWVGKVAVAHLSDFRRYSQCRMSDPGVPRSAQVGHSSG